MRLGIRKTLTLSGTRRLRPLRGNNSSEILADYGFPILFSVLSLVSWEYAVRVLNVPKFLLPAPTAVFQRLVLSRNLLVQHTLVTMFEAIAGFALASIVAFAIAVSISYSRVVERTVYPYVVMAKVVPIVAVAPLLMLWFGFGVMPKVVVSALVCFFPIVVNTVKGLRSTDHRALRLMRVLSANAMQTFLKVKLPSTLPYLFAAFKIAVPLSVVGAIVGELVGSDVGLGHLIMVSEGYLDTEMMFVAVTLSAVLGLLLFLIVSMVEQVLVPWHEPVE
jgi:NitT/TauT family transport system permease protein